MKTPEKAKTLIESLMPLQENGHRSPCPRCGHDRMDDECGMDEAMRDIIGKPLPLSEWSMAISF